MANRHPDPGPKATFWQHQLHLWRRSGLSVRRFCARHGLSEPSFYFWRRRLEPKHPAFLPVRVVADTAPSSIPVEVVLGNERRVRVRAGFDRNLLLQVVETLEGRPC